MPEHSMQCACGQQFKVTQSDYGKVGRCAGCNRSLRVYLLRGEAYLEPADFLSAEVPAVFGATIASLNPSLPNTATSPIPQATVDPVSLFESDGEADDIYATASPSERCARCGRDFRGDWDKRQTDNGLYCYICSTLAIELPPDKDLEAPERTIKMPPPPALDVLADYRELSESFAGRHWGKILLFSIALVGLLAILVLPVEKILPALLTPVDEETLAQAPKNVVEFSLLIPHITVFCALFLWLYLGLSITDNLPNRRFHHNLVVVAVYAIGFFMLTLLSGIAFTYSARAYIFPIFIMVYFLHYSFDLSVGDTFKIVALGGVIAVITPFVVLLLQGLYLGIAL